MGSLRGFPAGQDRLLANMVFFFTGITGLVGSQAAVELLRAGHRVIALTRPGAGAPDAGRRRVLRILEAHPGAAGVPVNSSVLTLEGDLREPYCGLRESRAMFEGQVDAVVHCAAMLSFDDSKRNALFEANVDGSANAAALAGLWGCRRFVFVSTAFVDRALNGGTARTAYEASKLEAERVLGQSAARMNMDLFIIRPSVVAGDRAHGFTPNFKGVYPFLRFLARHSDVLRRIPCYPGGLSPETRVNLLPADDVAGIIRAVLEGAAGADRVFNLVNPRSWTAADLARVTAGLLGVDEREIERRLPGDMLPVALASAGQALVKEYAAYLDAMPELDTGPAAALRARAGMRQPDGDPDWMRAVLRWGIRRNWVDL